MIKCANCEEREGTIKWAGESSDPLALTHWYHSMPLWCATCVICAKIDHIQELQGWLPKYTQVLAKLGAGEIDDAEAYNQIKEKD